MRRRPTVWLLVLALGFTACSKGRDSSVDSGSREVPDAALDAGGRDAGAGDAGTVFTLDGPLQLLYPSAGAGWNDYVVSDGNSVLTASGTACSGDETGGYNRCLHAGELRAVPVDGHTRCAGLTAEDTLGAFAWTCDPSTTPVRVVSVGLKEGRGLADLIDFDAVRWKKNGVTVYKDAGIVFATPASVWWSNPVIENNSGGQLDREGAVYAVTGSGALAEYRLQADRVALVIQPGLVLLKKGTGSQVVQAIERKFLWIEGEVDAAGHDEGVLFGGGVRFSVMRKVRVTGGNWGISLSNNSSCNKLVDITVAENGVGLLMTFASNTLIQNLSAFNNDDVNVYLLNGNRNNTLLGVVSFGSVEGIRIDWSEDNLFVNTTSANNGRSIANNGVYLFAGSHNNLFVNTATVNNFGSGIQLELSDNNSFAGAVSADNGVSGSVVAAYSFLESTENYFTGAIKAGSKPSTKLCYERDSAEPGLEPGAGGCVNGGSSDAVITNGVTLAGAFVGKVGADSVNAHGSLGTLTSEQIVDWVHFENPLRGWGLDEGVFPARDHMGRCDTDDICRIWDWSLESGDTVALGANGALPTGDDVVRHVWGAATAADCAQLRGAAWGNNVCSISGYQAQGICEAFGGDWTSDKCTSLFLRRAVELVGDHIGNDNGLCESDETCLFTPNLGSYQGHGALEVTATIGDGAALERITLLQYAENGR